MAGFGRVVFQLYNGTNIILNNSQMNRNVLNTVQTDIINFTQNWTNLDEGNYTISVYANDSLANTRYLTNSTIIIDRTAPNITFTQFTGITGPSNGTPLNGQNLSAILINVTTNDTSTNTGKSQVGGGFVVFELYNDTGLVNRTISARTTFGKDLVEPTSINFTNALIGLVDGNYTIRVVVNDSLNNNIPTINRTNFLLDRTAPTLSIASNTQSTNMSSVIGQTRIFINITSNDTNNNRRQAGSGFYLFQLYNETTGLLNSTVMSRTTYLQDVSESATLNMSVLGLNDLEDGIYFVNVTVNDSVGNRALTGERRIYIDRTAPNITYRDFTGVTGPSNGTQATNANITAILLNVTVNDTLINRGQVGGGFVVFELHNGSGLLNRTQIATTKFAKDLVEGNFVNFTNAVISLADGSYTFNVTANDSLNNRIISVSRSVNIDRTPLNISILGRTPNQGAYIVDGNLFVNLSTNDTNFGLSQFGGGFVVVELHNSTGLLNRSIQTRTRFGADTVELTTFNVSYKLDQDLSDGNYSWNITVNDSVGNTRYLLGYSTVIDRVNPSTPLITSSQGSTFNNLVTTSLTCTSTDTNIKQVSMIATGISDPICTGVNSCSSNYRPTSSGVKTATCTALDYVGHSVENTLTLSINSEGGGSSSGGGGGGGGSSASVDNVKAGTPTVFTINNPALDVQKLTITTNTVVADVKMTVTGLSEKPANLPDVASGNAQVYKYFEVTKSNLQDTQVSSAKITFTVNKEWLIINKANKDDVVLYRLVNAEWKPYTAIMQSENEKTYTYESAVPGFSTFAIGLKTSTTVPETITPVEATSSEETTTIAETINPTTATSSSKSKVLVIVLVALVIIIIIVALLLKSKRKSTSTKGMAYKPR